MQQPVLTRYYPWLLFILVAALLPGLFIPLMEPDAALYAGIAKQIVLRHDWVNLYANGTDWLDKPHLPFWISAASYSLLGINTFAYKLPAFLCWLAGAGYTFLLARRFYGQTAAQVATVIYLTALHAILSSNDVRAEPYLTLFLVAASWHLVRSMDKPLHIVPAALFTAAAIMTKGLFVLIPIGGGMLLHWGMTGNIKQLWQPKWYIYLLITAVFTLPEIWCLYQQFDAQPAKTVFNRQGVSGIRFFLWDSQFGRFLNTGPIKGKGDPFFFLHTLLWAFLPWSLLLYAAIFQRLRKFKAGVEWITIGAGLLTLVVFSLSRFQLPHYLNILFPYFSVLLAAWLCSLNTKGTKAVNITQGIVVCIMLVLATGINILYRAPGWWLFLAIAAAGFTGWWLWRKPVHLLYRCITGSVVLTIFLNLFFYPTLLPYQGGSTAAAWANRQGIREPVHFFYLSSYSFEFYYQGPVVWNAGAEGLLYTGKKGKAELDSLATGYQALAVFPAYKVTRIDGKFVNAATRNKHLDSVWLLRIDKKIPAYK